MPPQCEAFKEDEFEDYLLGHSPAIQAKAISDHCRSCPDCRGHLSELEGFIVNLRVALSRVEVEVAAAASLGTADREETDTREGPRLPCNVAVSVSYLGDNGVMRRVSGELIDRSVEGAALVVPEAIPVDISALITIKTRTLDATIKYCEASESGFRIGVKLVGRFGNGRR